MSRSPSTISLFLFWHGDEIGRNQDIYFWRNYSTVLAATLWKGGIAFPFGIIAPLALLGLLLSGRRQEFVLFAVFVGVYCLSVVAFFPTARYRAPLLPLLVFFATLGPVGSGPASGPGSTARSA